LQQAINNLLSEHEIFAQGFVPKDGYLERRVVPQLKVALPCIDLSIFIPGKEPRASS